MSTTEQRHEAGESEFDRGVAVRERAEEPGTYDAELGAGWGIGPNINGGLLLAACGNALKQRLTADGHPDPVSVSGYYLSATRSGLATLRTDVIRQGRSLSTGVVSLEQDQDGRRVERLRVLAMYGDLGGLPDEVHTTAVPPEMPAPDDCVPTDRAPADFLEQAKLLGRVDLRLDPSSVGWAVGEPSGRGVIQGWLRMADGREPDPLMLLLAVDALPPVTFDLGMSGWTPTLELTAHIRACPAPGWLRVALSTRNYAGGLLEEDAEVWDSSGRLVAQSRQLARAPRRRA